MSESSEFSISTDPARLDVALIHRFLSRESYWARDVAVETVQRALRNSLCFGLYEHGAQVGFARVVTDAATFGYLADVFVIASHRGRGLGRRLIGAVLAHPDLQGLRRLMLATRDAQGFYQPFGFGALTHPHTLMQRHGGDTDEPPALD